MFVVLKLIYRAVFEDVPENESSSFISSRLVTIDTNSLALGYVSVVVGSVHYIIKSLIHVSLS